MFRFWSLLVNTTARVEPASEPLASDGESGAVIPPNGLLLAYGEPFAIAGTIAFPYDTATKPHELRFELVDADGSPLLVPSPPEGAPEPFVMTPPAVCPGIPPGTPMGASIPAVMAIGVRGLPLAPATRYEFRFTIDGVADEGWVLPFSTPRLREAKAA